MNFKWLLSYWTKKYSVTLFWPDWKSWCNIQLKFNSRSSQKVWEQLALYKSQRIQPFGVQTQLPYTIVSVPLEWSAD